MMNAWNTPAKLCAVVLIGVAGSMPLSAQDGPPAMPPAPVEVSTASRQSMASVLMAQGTVVSRNDAQIAAEVSGLLTWVADVGVHIDAGGVIARIDDRELQLQLRTDQATVKRLEANLTYMTSQVDRLQQLALDNIAAKDQLDQAIANKAMAEQDLVQARVTLERTFYDIERSQVRAPFSGQIVERMRHTGEYIPVGGNVARLVDTVNIEVSARAPMAVAPYIVDGMPVMVSDKIHALESEIRSVIPVGDQQTRMFEVRLTLRDKAWAIGTAVQVALPKSEPAEVVAVPRDALILRQNTTYLYKVIGDNKVEQIAVKTGAGNGAYIEVRGDVADGDQIVVRGGERLQPGQSFKVNCDC